MSLNILGRSGAWIALVALFIAAGCATPTTLKPEDKELLQSAMKASGGVESSARNAASAADRAEAAASRAEAAASRAEAAADRVEAAAARAEEAANKASKAFQLQQRK